MTAERQVTSERTSQRDHREQAKREFEHAPSWLKAVRCDMETGITRMQARYRDIAASHEAQREDRLREMIIEELEAADREYQAITEARLRAWLHLAKDDRDSVRLVARSYDAVFARLPGALEFRRAMAVQAVVARVITDEDRQTLLDLVPGIARFLPPTSLRLAPRPDAATDEEAAR